PLNTPAHLPDWDHNLLARGRPAAARSTEIQPRSRQSGRERLSRERFARLPRQPGQSSLPAARPSDRRNSTHWTCAPWTFPSLACTTLQISFTFSRLLAMVTCPIESHA